MSKSLATCHVPQLIKRIRKLGLTNRSAAIALRVTLAALRSLLLEGENIALPSLGKMVFIKRNGRHHPGNGFCGKGPFYQNPSHSIKFEMDPTFRAEVKKVVPKKPKLPYHWKGRLDKKESVRNFERERSTPVSQPGSQGQPSS